MHQRNTKSYIDKAYTQIWTRTILKFNFPKLLQGLRCVFIDNDFSSSCKATINSSTTKALRTLDIDKDLVLTETRMFISIDNAFHTFSYLLFVFLEKFEYESWDEGLPSVMMSLDLLVVCPIWERNHNLLILNWSQTKKIWKKHSNSSLLK